MLFEKISYPFDHDHATIAARLKFPRVLLSLRSLKVMLRSRKQRFRYHLDEKSTVSLIGGIEL